MVRGRDLVRGVWIKVARGHALGKVGAWGGGGGGWGDAAGTPSITGVLRFCAERDSKG